MKFRCTTYAMLLLSCDLSASVASLHSGIVKCPLTVLHLRIPAEVVGHPGTFHLLFFWHTVFRILYSREVFEDNSLKNCSSAES